jgi:hypothetical protein
MKMPLRTNGHFRPQNSCRMPERGRRRVHPDGDRPRHAARCHQHRRTHRWVDGKLRDGKTRAVPELKESKTFLSTSSANVYYLANDHLIEFHLIEIVIFQLIEISLIT